MKTKKRFLSILLSLALVLGLMPGMGLTAYAGSPSTYTIKLGSLSLGELEYVSDATLPFTFTGQDVFNLFAMGAYWTASSVSQTSGSNISVSGLNITVNGEGSSTIKVYDGSDSLSVTVSVTKNVAHTHNFTYAGNGAIITATCIGEGDCDYKTNGITLTLNTPTSLSYDGTAKTATISGYPATVPAGLAAAPTTVTYYKSSGAGSTTTSGDALSGAPMNAGNYVAQMTWGGKNASVAFTIASADLTDVSVAQNGTLTYTGEAQTPQVTTAATAVNNQTVTFTYSKTRDGEYGDMPTVTNVSDSGTFYYKATAPNHNDVTSSFTVTMNKGTAPTVDTPTLEAVTYDPAKTLESVALPDGWAWVTKTTVPTVTNNGYAAEYTVPDYTNYDYANVEGYDAQTHKVTRIVTLIVNKANAVAATITANNRTYDGTEKPLVTVTGEPTGGTMYYALGENATTAPADELYTTSIPTATDAGTYYVWYKVKGDANHKDSKTASVTVTITQDEGEKEVSTEIKKDAKSPELKADNLTKEFAESTLSTVEKAAVEAAVEAGKDVDIDVYLDIKDISDSISSADKDKVKAVVAEADAIEYFDISLFKEIFISNQSQGATALHTLSTPLKLTIGVPKSFPAVADGYTRTYEVIRLHDGVAEKLPTTANADGTISFETDKFSIYALAYTDVKKEASTTDTPTTKVDTPTTEVTTTKAPITGDQAKIGIVVMLMLDSGMAALYLALRKKMLK